MMSCPSSMGGGSPVPNSNCPDTIPTLLEAPMPICCTRPTPSIPSAGPYPTSPIYATSRNRERHRRNDPGANKSTVGRSRKTDPPHTHNPITMAVALIALPVYRDCLQRIRYQSRSDASCSGVGLAAARTHLTAAMASSTFIPRLWHNTAAAKAGARLTPARQ